MPKQKLIVPTAEENQRINRGISEDPDTLELTDDLLPLLRPAVRGKQRAPTKVRTTVRFSPEVIEIYRGLGRGWQTRMDKDLCELIARKYKQVLQDGELVTVECPAKEND